MYVSKQDFVIGLSILSRGSLEEKLKWTFSLYDINGDGAITKEEMTEMIAAIYDLMGKCTEPIDEALLKAKVDGIFEVSSVGWFSFFEQFSQQKMDLNHDGVVTIDEFVNCCTTDPDISASMGVFDTAF